MALRDPDRPRFPPWAPFAILAAGLGVSLLLTGHGGYFLFLPIILPLGLGGGSWIKKPGPRREDD